MVLGIELIASHMVGKYSFNLAIAPAVDPYFNYEKIINHPLPIEEQTQDNKNLMKGLTNF